MNKEETRHKLEAIIGQRVSMYHSNGLVYGNAVGVTEDGKLVVEPLYQSEFNVGQIGGNHYQCLRIQPVEYNYANGLPFIEGSVVKYITRHRNKNKAEDVKKAIHFCIMLLKLEYGYTKKELEELL